MKKVLLIYGGVSCEHDVSCQSAKSIIQNTDGKYLLDSLYITKNNEWIHKNCKVDNIIKLLQSYDIIFPITHGNNGEDGKLQGILDFFNVNYIGCDWGTSYICMDKKRTKEILGYYKIPQVPFEIYTKNKKPTIDYPVIIKPARSGSSYGINIANNYNEFKKAIKAAKKYDGEIIIEKFINSQELECAIIYDKKWIISNIGEIKSANIFYDYEAKYKSKESKCIIPADIDDAVKKEIEYYVKKIIDILNIKGLARIDFFYDKEYKKVYLNEINTLPGFTNASMYPKLLFNKGYTYQKIISTLIDNAQ